MRVDFYVLSTTAAYGLLACRLLEKAYLRGHRVFVHCQTAKAASSLDELLWTFKPDSFIPHCLQDDESKTAHSPIQLGYGPQEPQGFNDILINLAEAIPTFYINFQRIIEIVEADEPAKLRGRDHFRCYRNAGCTVATHNFPPPTSP